MYQKIIRMSGGLSPKLGMAYVESPLNKWLILLREFMLHLESLMGKNAVASEWI
jgi:hypothetical protein